MAMFQFKEQYVDPTSYANSYAQSFKREFDGFREAQTYEKTLSELQTADFNRGLISANINNTNALAAYNRQITATNSDKQIEDQKTSEARVKAAIIASNMKAASDQHTIADIGANGKLRIDFNGAKLQNDISQSQFDLARRDQIGKAVINQDYWAAIANGEGSQNLSRKATSMGVVLDATKDQTERAAIAQANFNAANNISKFNLAQNPRFDPMLGSTVVTINGVEYDTATRMTVADALKLKQANNLTYGYNANVAASQARALDDATRGLVYKPETGRYNNQNGVPVNTFGMAQLPPMYTPQMLTTGTPPSAPATMGAPSVAPADSGYPEKHTATRNPPATAQPTSMTPVQAQEQRDARVIEIAMNLGNNAPQAIIDEAQAALYRRRESVNASQANAQDKARIAMLQAAMNSLPEDDPLRVTLSNQIAQNQAPAYSAQSLGAYLSLGVAP